MESQMSCDGFFFEPEIECYQNPEQPTPKARPGPSFFGLGPDPVVTKERRGSMIGMAWNNPPPMSPSTNNTSANNNLVNNNLVRQAIKERRDSVTNGFRRNSLLWFAGDEAPWDGEPATQNTNPAPPEDQPEGIFEPMNLNTVCNRDRRLSIKGIQDFLNGEYGKDAQQIKPVQKQADFEWVAGMEAPKAKQAIPSVFQSQNLAPSAAPASAPATGRKPKGGKIRCRTNKKPQYWTPDEHEKFLAGLEKFGLQDGLGPGGAELLSMWMGNRSVLQIKSHAQKYWSDLAAGRVTCPR